MDGSPHIRVLVVDDDSQTRIALHRLLQLEGFAADEARTLADAKAHVLLYDWVILDLHLTDGDGVELLRYIREHHLPVKVAVATGSAEHEQIGEVGKLKPEIILIKPFMVAELFKGLRSHSDAVDSSALTRHHL